MVHSKRTSGDTIMRNGLTISTQTRMMTKATLSLFLVVCALYSHAQVRRQISLNENWRSIASENDQLLPARISGPAAEERGWATVQIPHNWDAYHGYRRMLHGNRHGEAWYSKRFRITENKKGKRFFLFFEGVGSNATVYLNEKRVGAHAGGRTSFTLDVSDVIYTDGRENNLAVKASHPSNIKDLPWVCGGCSEERGFSEGSQPMGIFRPVSLVVTNELRLAPFGIHAWSDSTLSSSRAPLFTANTIRNYGSTARHTTIVTRLLDAKQKTVAQSTMRATIKSGDSISLRQQKMDVIKPSLWTDEHPYLYTVRTEIFENGKPVFINGIAEYEHLLGASHAFTPEQIHSRMKWIRSAGLKD